MKIVINDAYGGITDESAALRTNPFFVEEVESGRFEGRIVEQWGYAEILRVVEIPNDATDYRILNYDGCELVIYVHDGLIYYTPANSDAARLINHENNF